MPQTVLLRSELSPSGVSLRRSVDCATQCKEGIIPGIAATRSYLFQLGRTDSSSAVET
jgi:hypothetical protein